MASPGILRISLFSLETKGWVSSARTPGSHRWRPQGGHCSPFWVVSIWRSVGAGSNWRSFFCASMSVAGIEGGLKETYRSIMCSVIILESKTFFSWFSFKAWDFLDIDDWLICPPFTQWPWRLFRAHLKVKVLVSTAEMVKCGEQIVFPSQTQIVLKTVERFLQVVLILEEKLD